ncbi:MAG: EAL domain-containing protein [Gammaproteobacteria bacterium]
MSDTPAPSSAPVHAVALFERPAQIESIGKALAEEQLCTPLQVVTDLKALIDARATRSPSLVLVARNALRANASLSSYLRQWLSDDQHVTGILVSDGPTAEDFLLAAQCGLVDVVDRSNTTHALFVAHRELSALALRGKLGAILSGLRRSQITETEQTRYPATSMNVDPLALHIESAIAHDGVKLLFQPIVAVKGTSFDSYEVLTRISDGDQSIEAARFLPIANRYGMMPALDRLIVRQALRRFIAETRANTGPRSLRFFINVASVSLVDATVLGHLLTGIRRFDPPKGAIVIEMDKDTVITNLDHAKQLNRKIKELGLAFALDFYEPDDLRRNYLEHLDIDFLKLHAPTLEGVATNPERQKQVSAIVHYANEQGLSVIACQVEDMADLAWLARSGVRFLQGYALAEPAATLSPAVFESFEI